MPPDRTKGKYASNQGNLLEHNVITTFESKGFQVIMFREWNKHPEKYGKELLLKNVPFINIYESDSNTEFLLKSDKYKTEIRIECKWQQSSGSVDEKFPYLYLNCIEAMPEKHILIVLDGEGARPKAIEWLKKAISEKLYTNENNKNKNIEVMKLTEFMRWANNTFR